MVANTVEVRGRGKKRGTVVHLTPGQRAAAERALTGYLSQLEATGADYPLFPSGRLTGWTAIGGEKVNGKRIGHRLVATDHLRAPVRAERKPIDRSTIDNWFEDAEDLAKVKHVKGRSWYGLRRVFVDAASDEGISSEALQEHGGWDDSQVPERIYRGKARKKARDAARDVRKRPAEKKTEVRSDAGKPCRLRVSA